MIEVRGLTKSYGAKKAVENVSFQLKKGETLVLIGPSGCGKTTTLKMINRLIEPDTGKILINGTNVRERNVVQLRRQTGYVIQENNLFPHYTVRQNILTVPRLLKKSQKEMKSRLHQVLHLVDLSDEFLDRYPDELSGGQQQRVAIARAIMAKPPLLLLDEPFSALDPLTRISVQQNFMQLTQATETTSILVTHDISEAISIGDRIALMSGGKIMQIGKPAELIFAPANKFVQSFFENNRFELELQTTYIRDLLPFLETKSCNDQETLKVKKDESLFSCLNAMAKNEVSAVCIIKGSEESVLLYQEELMKAFLKFKTSRTPQL